jgi:hypothetical protein
MASGGSDWTIWLGSSRRPFNKAVYDLVPGFIWIFSAVNNNFPITRILISRRVNLLGLPVSRLQLP